MEDLEGKFRSLEIDAEIQKLKQQLKNLNHQNTGVQTQSQNNHTATQNSSSNPSTKEERKTRFYKILGLPPTASNQEVKQAYKQLVKRCHPDLFFDNPPLRQKAQEILTKINQAYDELCSKNQL